MNEGTWFYLRQTLYLYNFSTAGLDDMVLSSLVKEQIEGLTPLAISLIPPRKMAVRIENFRHYPCCVP